MTAIQARFSFTLLLPALLSALLSGCASDAPLSSTPGQTPAAQRPPSAPPADAPPSASGRGGGYYLDDGPGDTPPPDLDKIADAKPKNEPLHRYANRPYTVMGRSYTPIATRENFRERGTASWYGKRFHGQKTSSGELYDMYAMTAAHPTLPIPSYVRVVNVENGRSVVVRINDRGPFLHNRVIDLSYAAAHRLDYIKSGKAKVEIETVLPPIEDEANALSEAPAPVRIVRAMSDLPGHYLQLGAFSKRDNAEELQARIADRVSEQADKLDIVPGDGLFRLQLGPYKTRGEAAVVAEKLRERLDLQPHLVVR